MRPERRVTEGVEATLPVVTAQRMAQATVTGFCFCEECGHPLTERQKVALLTLRCSSSTACPVAPPSGCRFHTRCRFATEICSAVEPPLVAHRDGHLAACHHPLDSVPPPAVLAGRAA